MKFVGGGIPVYEEATLGVGAYFAFAFMLAGVTICIMKVNKKSQIRREKKKAELRGETE